MSKTHITMVCPCCGGEVTHQRYSFSVIDQAPLKITEWFVCDACEAALKGDDHAARHAAEQAFLDYLEGLTHAPAA